MNYLNDNIIQNENLFWRKIKNGQFDQAIISYRLNDTSTVLYNIENNFFEDWKLIEPSIHDSLFKLLSAWENRLIDPNWIENMIGILLLK